MPQPARSTSALDELVIAFLDRVESSGNADIEAFCAEHGDATGELRARLIALRDAGLLGVASAPQPESFPEQLGEFRLLERLGGGGMGMVYLAEQTTLGRRVALKLVRPEQLFFPGARERFRREVEAVAKLAHPGIVPVYAFGEENGLPFFAMEHVEGVSLSRVLESVAGRAPETLSAADIARELERAGFAPERDVELFSGSWVHACTLIVRQVAEALAHAHARGVLHRDIKPSNVMLTANGRARLVDFGLATREGAQRLTRTGLQLGSLAYMPPEQASGSASGSNASWDLYSLGVTLYELLTLRLPFFSESTTTLMKRIADGLVEPPRRFNPSVPADVETVCLTAMAPEPGRRYASASALVEDLTRVLELRPIAARRASTALRVQRWAQRNPARAVAVALAVLVAIGGPLAYALVERNARNRVELANTELSRSNAELAKAKLEIEHKNTDLESALGRAEAQRVRAEGNFDRSLRAVTTLLGDVGAEGLEDEPGMDRLRKKLLDKALAFYRELLDEKPGDFDVRQEQARVGRAMADVLHAQGSDEDAERLYSEQIARFRELSQQNPGNVDHRYSVASCESQLAMLRWGSGHADEARPLLDEARATLTDIANGPDVLPNHVRDLIVVLSNLALVARTQGNLEQAVSFLEEGIARSTALVDAHPDNDDYRSALASALADHATMLSSLNRRDEARADLARAYDMHEHLVRADPESREFRVQLIEVCGNYGLLLGQLGEADEAERVLVRGRDVAAQLVHDFPNVQRYQMNLAGVSINLGAHIGAHGRLDDAVAAFALARDTLEKLVAVAPEVVEHHFYLATALQNIAGLELDNGHLEAGLKAIERSLAEFDAALAKAPNHPGILAQRGFTQLALADALRLQGRYAEAVAKAQEVSDVAKLRADLFVNQAEVFASTAAAAEKDAALPDDERARFVRDNLDRGLAALRNAFGGSFGDVAYVRSSPKLERLRSEPAFEALVAEFTAAHQ